MIHRIPVAPGRFRRGSPDEALPCGPAPIRTTRIDPARLPVKQSPHYQPSVIRYNGRLVCAFRSGHFNSRLLLAELREDYQPKGSFTALEIHHPRCTIGQEDPRLFIFRGRLHVAFVGCEADADGLFTNVMYARLTDDLRIDEVFYPHFPERARWEKNWSFFDDSGQLLCVYSILPHRLFEINGETVTPLPPMEWAPRWTGGLMRGGASVARVRGEYWHWFHGWLDFDTVAEKWRTYSIGAYVFEGAPPFRPLRYTPAPLLWPDATERHPKQSWASVVFPCGAILEDGIWRVSYGRQEQFAEIAEWRHADVEAVMQFVPPLPDAR